MLLPAIRSRSDYVNVIACDPVWLPAMRVICEHHRLSAEGLQRQVIGTHVVFRTGDAILKLFCPLWAGDFEAERLVLRHIHGLPAPEVVAEGDLEGWPYLVTRALPGSRAGDLWPGLSLLERTEVIEQIGDLMRRLHQQPPVEELSRDWNAFVEERIADASRHHEAAGALDDWLRERLGRFSEGTFEPVLLDCDLTDDHVLIGSQGGRWKITGVIDFGDAMMGHPCYEFVAPLACFAFGQPVLARALVRSYGWQLDAGLAEKLVTYCLLHRYARLRDFQRKHPFETPDAFRAAMWGA